MNPGGAALLPDVRKGFAFPISLKIVGGYASNFEAKPRTVNTGCRKGEAFPHIKQQSRD